MCHRQPIYLSLEGVDVVLIEAVGEHIRQQTRQCARRLVVGRKITLHVGFGRGQNLLVQARAMQTVQHLQSHVDGGDGGRIFGKSADIKGSALLIAVEAAARAIGQARIDAQGVVEPGREPTA